MIETAAIAWTSDGAPRSLRFDDVYFSRAGGLQEARAVFLAGCGLPDAWAGRERFVVGELGLGTGLNVLATLDLWRRARGAGQRLHIFSIEAFPLTAADARRSLDAWPALADVAEPVLTAWPAARGFHRIDLPGSGAVLDVAVMEAAEALEAWDGRADAWFLDGFSPARNPEIWREEVLALVARRSAPGARAASYTVAGAVRRGLEAQGFEVARRPGFGGKAERLEARLAAAPGTATARRGAARVCIIGAGIAGAALARTFAAEGLRPVIIEADAPAAGASGNPAALVTPRLDAGGGPPAQLHAQAFARAVRLYEAGAAEAIIARGALQLEAAPRDSRRFDAVAGADVFAPGALLRLDAEALGARLGEPCAHGGLLIRDGLVLDPKAVITAFVQDADVIRSRAAAIEPAGEAWRVLGATGRILSEAEIVCVAAGFASAAILPGLPLQPVRGQASIAEPHAAEPAAAWGGYVIPTRTGILFGATHDRGDARTDLRSADNRRNLEHLATGRPALARALETSRLGGRAGVRASTPDRLPLAGAAIGRSGVFVLSGLGGRGFALSPLLGEHIAALALGAPSPLPGPLSAAIAPARFS